MEMKNSRMSDRPWRREELNNHDDDGNDNDSDSSSSVLEEYDREHPARVPWVSLPGDGVAVCGCRVMTKVGQKQKK